MIRLILLLLFLFSCSDDIIDNEISWVRNLSISRNSTELYIQAELSESLDIESIDSVSIDLEYIGSADLEYKQNFILYDDGVTGGDIIENNGIYTLIASSEDLIMPDDSLEIDNISFPTSHRLIQSDLDSIKYSIRIKGNQYSADVNIFDNNNYYIYSENINIDNTELEVWQDKSLLMVDDDGPEPCDRYLKYEGMPPSRLPYDYSEPIIDIDDWNYLEYKSMFFIEPMDSCGTTGTTTFIFILTDSDTGESIQEEKTVVIYGCGDSICTDEYETNASCPGDCP